MALKQTLHLYLRVSTSIQETKGTSLKSQKDAGIALAKRLDMDFQIHNEGGKSSAKDDLNNRPVMLELLRLMDAGVVKNIYVWNTDRLSRNQITWYSIRQKMVKNNVVLYTSQGRYDITDGLENLLLGILSEVSTYDNLIRSERSRLGKIEKVQKNYWRGGDCPFGYKLENTDGVGNKLVICDYESKWVRFIYTEYINGVSCREIKKSLEENQVLTRRRNANWSLGSIQLILRNNTYLGIDQYRDKKTGLLINNSIPQIIPNNIFDDAQKKRTKTLERKGQNNRLKQFFLLREMLVCGGCGTQLGCKKIKDRNVNHYYCPIPERRFNRSYKDVRKCEASKVMDATATDLEVWNLIESTLTNSGSIKTALKATGRLDLVDQSDILNKTILIEAEIQKTKLDLKRLESNLIELETEKILKQHSDNVYNGIRKNLITKINQTKVAIERYQNEQLLLKNNNSWVDGIENIGGYIKDLNNIDETQKREVLKHLVKDIIVTYNQGEKCHNLKVNLAVPLIMDYTLGRPPSRRTLCVGEGTNQTILRKPKSGHDYSTVTDFARFLGLSTSMPFATPT
jgi:site-specific DNA recombinase